MNEEKDIILPTQAEFITFTNEANMDSTAFMDEKMRATLKGFLNIRIKDDNGIIENGTYYIPFYKKEEE